VVIQLAASSSGFAVSRHVTVRPTFSRTMSEAFSRSTKCFVAAASVIASGAASSLTAASPSAKRARTARRVGSANAWLRAGGSGILVFDISGEAIQGLFPEAGDPFRRQRRFER
jgi:hypothetical protein